MRSKTTVRFRKAFAALPKKVQDQARKSYRQFKQDPWHPSLRFKQVHPNIPIYSARISKGYRAVGQRTENKVVWFWIGSHGDYEKLLSQLGYNDGIMGYERMMGWFIGFYNIPVFQYSIIPESQEIKSL